MHLNSGAYRDWRDIESPPDYTCPDCDGEGALPCPDNADDHDECDRCDGRGWVR
jgi:DnaJ-class molecular chaperone